MEFALLAIFAVLNGADIFTSKRVFELGGTEENPVVRWFINALGIVPGMLAIKTPIFVGIAWLVLSGGAPALAVGVACGIYLAIVFRNHAVYKKLVAEVEARTAPNED